ncbi:MAG: SpoIIE family protein phosphatase [Bacteroidetes bacterium]|nr:SpoIIE family protein phosphatase [Bacteroidota bacterium]
MSFQSPWTLLLAVLLLTHTPAWNQQDSLQTELEKAKTDSAKVDLLLQLGWIILGENPEEALTYGLTAEPLVIRLKDPYRAENTYRLMAFCYGDMNDRPSCLENHMKRIHILESIGERSKLMASAYYEAASVLDSQNQDEAAEIFYNKCSQLGMELNMKTLYAYPLLPLSGMKSERGDTVGAKADLRLAYSLIQNQGTPIEPILLANLSVILIEQDSLEEAKRLIDSAYILLPSLDQPEVAGFVYQASGLIQTNLGNPAKAVEEFHKALDNWEPLNKYFYLQGLYLQLARAYSTVNADSAVHYFEKHIELSKQVNNEDNNAQIAEMEARYKNEEKQKEIELLSADKKLADLENTRQSQISTLVSTLLGAVILFSIFLISRIRIIRKQNNLIQEQKREVVQQKEIVEEKSREIFDSITYARRIQSAAMPDPKAVEQYLSKVIVTYIPKDQLSGDFYWFGKMKSKEAKEMALFALGDCTGHGVPGALLSILGINYLNVSQAYHNLTDPSHVLNFLNEGIFSTFQASDNEIRDGMDIALVAVDPDKKKLYYAAAKNPVYILRQSTLIILKGDSHAVGKGTRNGQAEHFNLFEFDYEPDDIVYLFSDGYADQFGGEKGKKFSSKRLRNYLTEIKNQPLKKQQNILEENFKTWKGNFEQLDDVCFIGVQL